MNERPSDSKFSPPDAGNFRALFDLLPTEKNGKASGSAAELRDRPSLKFRKI